ncbi:MAG: rhomboid-like protein [Gordonia sp. (in: high G+C Gram-positive bacteria)]|uniref:rhomboid-like protein n=1 Tax=Gordonia TaxID=2053 RepID=UPI0032651FE6
MSAKTGRLRWTAAAIGRWIRSAPITYSWLVVLLVTTVVQHRVSPRRLERILGHRSTNIENLLHDPLRAIFGSLFWLDGAYWLPYLIGFTIFLATAERWLGAWRFVAVGLAGHLLATLISQGLVGAAIDRGRANPSLAYAVDVGVSYFMAAIIGVLAYRLSGRWRWGYLAGCAVVFLAPLFVPPVTFTDIGHASALLIGVAMHPIVRGRPTLDVDAVIRSARQRLRSSLPTVRHRNS